MKVILNVIENLNEENPKKPGKFKTIKRGIVSKLQVDTMDFVAREIYDSKGRIVKSKTLIIHNKLGEMIVRHKFDDVIKMGAPQIVRGFRR